MRTLEAILIAVNVLAITLSFKRQSRAVWWTIAGVNLAVLLIHGVMEGFRYQMIFPYLFVGLLVIYVLAKTITRLYAVKIPMALKAITIAILLGSLALSAFLAYALPVFTLPKPTGSYAVGVEYFHLVDEKRADPFLDQSTQKRELIVKVYYPATGDDSKAPARYFHNDSRLIEAFAAFNGGLPSFLFDYLRLVKTHTKEGLALSDQQASYPVLLFSHGAGTSMEVQTSQSEDLASHGYIVAAIDHTYVSAATGFPERVVRAGEATTDFHMGDPAEVITQIMADDAIFVIDTLAAMNAGSVDSRFAGRLDLAHIGAMGHSVGGATAYNLAINESRVKAAFNLDGRVFITPQADAAMAPLLMVAHDQGHVQSLQNRASLLQEFATMPEVDQQITVAMYGSKEAYDVAYQKSLQAALALRQELQASGNLYTITGCDHMQFTDIGLLIGIPQLRKSIGIAGDTDPARCLAISTAVAVTFFDQYLQGEAGASVESLINQQPELKKVALP